LYNQPVNLFVAFFIGAPSINLFDATIEAQNGSYYVRTKDFRALLPERFKAKVADHVDGRVILGIRPEDLHVPRKAPFEVTEDNTVEGVLNEIEPTSSGCAAYLNTVEGEKDFVATFKLRLPASYLGQTIPLGINMDK